MQFKIMNTTSKKLYVYNVTDTNYYARAYYFPINFDCDMEEGEYQAVLLDDRFQEVWLGLLQIGKVIRVGRDGAVHDKNIEFKQYEG